MIPNGGDNIQVVCALSLYAGDITGIVHVLCPNDGDNTHTIRSLMSESTQNKNPHSSNLWYYINFRALSSPELNNTLILYQFQKQQTQKVYTIF